MRIISEFHDYYDCVQAQGQDLSVVWVRKQKEVALPKTDPNERRSLKFNFPFPVCEATTYHACHRARLWCYQSIVGFCGKIYPLLELSIPSQDDEPTLCYSLEEVDAFMEANFKEKQLKEYRKTKGYSLKWDYSNRRVIFQKFFDECKQKQGDYEDKWFRDHRCPVFVAKFRPKSESSSLVLNAELKELKFYRIFDTNSAFQEIYSYMSNLAAPQEVIPEIDDVTMAEAKGFDKKWSFRKEPTKKR